MGASNWSDDTYRDRQRYIQQTGRSAFDFHDQVTSGKVAVALHPKMDPKGVTRESRDSDLHPNSKPIGVIFDETGSMGEVPRRLQQKLPQLMALLLRKGYIEDPQILMGAVGDARCDRAPLQVGQFESGVEMDEDLGRIYLEGSGGGNGGESYLLPMYFFARHTVSDAWEKRREKGYLFIVGDEPCHLTLTKREARGIFGDNLERDLTAQEIIEEVRERYHLFFIIPEHAYNHVREHWEGLIGKENVLTLESPEAVCETIALSIGLCEGTVDLNTGADHIKESGGSVAIVQSVTSALHGLSKKTVLARAGQGTLPERKGKTNKIARL